MKTSIDRIAFYYCKVNDYSKRRFDAVRGRSVKLPPTNRYDRLLRYKLALDERIKFCEPIGTAAPTAAGSGDERATAHLA